MKSCLYECEVMHARLIPRRHRFAYRIFLFAIDLDELGTLHRRLRLFSVNRPNLYSFRDRDFLPTHEPIHPPSAPRKCHPIGDTPPRPPVPSSARECHHPGDTPAAPNPHSEIRDLKSRVLAHLASRGIGLAGGRVQLVTLPRVLGYLFNPVSFYFCFDRDGEPVAALAEVTNTFREMKPFLLGPGTRLAQPETTPVESAASPLPQGAAASSSRAPASGLPPPASDPRPGETFRSRQPKHFYVSPFSDVDVAFEFKLTVPGEALAVRIDDFAGSERTLVSTLTGPRRGLTDARLAWFTFKYPLLTLWIILLIHWHALRLWLKRVPWFAKSDRPADQRDLYRPHASLAPPTVQAAPTPATTFPRQPETHSA